MLEQTGETEYTETAGLYYEDLVEGLTIHHRPGRTISEADNTWMTLLSMNKHPLHFDAEYAKNTEHGRMVVNSVVTFAIVNGMTVYSLSARTPANLGWNDVRLMHPVFIGDTLYASSIVKSRRLSASRPGDGIVTAFTTGFNGENTPVISFSRTFLVPCRRVPA